jgi:hypothetical protein
MQKKKMYIIIMLGGFWEMENKKVLFLGGTFDKNNGKSSEIARQVYEGMKLDNTDYFNGGNLQTLENIAKNISDYNLAFWFANVSNDEYKLIKKLKHWNKALVLVSSKRNFNKEYSDYDLIYHALMNKSNLIVEFSNNPLAEKLTYEARVLDPLGNLFLDKTKDMYLVGQKIKNRGLELLSYSRVPSEKLGEAEETEANEEFVGLINKYATVFHNLIHPNKENTDRFMGNASFRCESGFPSYKSGEFIFVSQRNIDKRNLKSNSFVKVKPEKNYVGYFGDSKPSVDTPIQVKLYDFYKNVKFLLHSHTYIAGAPFTKRIIPCGAIEEADDITELFPDKNKTNFKVNLNGHGSLVLSESPKYLQNLNYYARPFLENQENYRGSEK